ncbi:unnamed protein product [Bursaphelenchus okinawaensis]|uniref:Uncharacterized protein n=1 Tax=Bursaphelenchus okinawaensis TaxID=465554 RepID=A0A811LA68_9BILA|nr:unnamed protein product [Bursaphelenchus okinawaensis]CAG9119360.1 unnamed protein product [Bursaphelenchus okinawaensis]
MKGMDTDGKPYRSGGDGDSNRFIWTSEEVNEDRQANTERIRIYEAATGRVLSNIRSNVLPHAEISLLPRSRTIWINEMISNNQYRDKYAWYRIPRALKFNGKLVRPTNEIKRNCKINDHFCTSQWRPVTDYLLQNWLNGELCVYDERFEVWSDRDPSFTVQRVGRRLHKRIKQLRSHSLGDKHAIVSENSLRVDEMKKTMFMLEVNNGQVIARDIGNCTKLSTLKHLFYKIYVEIERSEATELCHQDFKLHLYENIRRCVLLYQREVLEQLRREGIHSN